MGERGQGSYFPFHYRLLRVMGLGYFHDPGQGDFNNFSKVWYTAYALLQLLWSVYFTTALWLAVPHTLDNLDGLMLNLTFSITFTSSLCKIYIVVRRNHTIQQVVHFLDEGFHDLMQSERILKDTATRSRRLTLCVLGFANVTVGGLVVGGGLQAYFSPANFYSTRRNNSAEFQPSDRILPVAVYTPITVHSDALYSVAFVYQIFGLAWCGNLVVIINTFMNTILIHFTGKFENLRFIIENITTIVKLEMVGELEKHKRILDRRDIENIELYKGKDVGGEAVDFRRETNHLLNKCIIKHVQLLRCVNEFKEVYSLGFLIHVLNNLGIVCYIMVQISENGILTVRFATTITLFLTVVSEMLVQCYTGNEMTLQALGLSASAYNCEWYLTDKQFRTSLLMVMMRAHSLTRVTAGNFTDISNATFVSIMKGAYSFQAVLRSVK